MTSIALQILINGLIAGGIYSLVASGFSLMYSVNKFMNFAHGATVVISAYFTYLFSDIIGLNFLLSALIGITMGVGTAIFTDRIVYGRERKRRCSNGIMLVTSLALLILFTNLIFLLFGSNTREFNMADATAIYNFGLFTITSVQIIMIVLSIIILILFWLLIKKTKIGKAMRATADNKDIAQVVGINSENIYLYSFIIAAITGSIAGILIGLDTNLFPMMGVSLIVVGFTAAVIGGANSIPGSVAGAFFIGLVENIVNWYLPTGYRSVIVFTLLFLFLIFRPQGLFGKVYER